MLVLIIGRHCCLFCTITKAEMQELHQPYPIRTLESLKLDFQKFEADGANLKNAKFYNNAIDNPLFNIPLDQVTVIISLYI